MLPLALHFPDGRTVTNVRFGSWRPRSEPYPDASVLSTSGASGTDRNVNARLFLTPVPPPGALTVTDGLRRMAVHMQIAEVSCELDATPNRTMSCRPGDRGDRWTWSRVAGSTRCSDRSSPAKTGNRNGLTVRWPSSAQDEAVSAEAQHFTAVDAGRLSCRKRTFGKLSDRVVDHGHNPDEWMRCHRHVRESSARCSTPWVAPVLWGWRAAGCASASESCCSRRADVGLWPSPGRSPGGQRQPPLTRSSTVRRVREPVQLHRHVDRRVVEYCLTSPVLRPIRHANDCRPELVVSIRSLLAARMLRRT
jgi:hypothetical protein